MNHFEIKAKDGLARLGKFTTKHGTVTTPLLMPVVHPAKSAIKPRDLVDKFGFQMLITNSYIIKRKEQFRKVAEEKGVHGLLDFEGPIMTDSGTFQMYFHDLPEEEIDPFEIVQFQKTIGSDVGTILDVFSAPNVGRKQVEEDVKISLERAFISLKEKEDMLLAGTVQGGVYPDLRVKSAKELGKLDFDVYPIGGVVPLMEQYRYADVVRVTLAAKKHLPPDRPVHLFGCGHPMFLAMATALGCDLFDSASYAKFAEDGRMLLTTGTVHLNELRELPCDCPICSRTNIDELRKMRKQDREIALMKHNLFVTAAEMRRIRQAIIDGKLFELVAYRARAHPSLNEAFHVLLEYFEQIEKSHPVGRGGSILYTGPETVKHVSFYRLQKRLLERFPYRETRTLVLVPHQGDTPFAETAQQIVDMTKETTPEELLTVFVTPFGVVPWELEHVHPAQQAIFPNILDSDTKAVALKRAIEFFSTISFEEAVWVTRNTPTNEFYEKIGKEFGVEKIQKIDSVKMRIKGSDLSDTFWMKRKLLAIFQYQWMLPNTQFIEQFEIDLSKTTGKIRHLRIGETILFTMIPNTGLLAPTFEGGVALLKWGVPKTFQVVMKNEAAEFVAAGKSALCKFVAEASPELRAGEEVVVLNEEKNLIAVGRALLNGREMLSFSRGVAVNTRHSQQP